MTSRNKTPVPKRERGGIIVEGKSAAQALVDKAFIKAEMKQWNSPKERQAGKQKWTGSEEHMGAPDEMTEDNQRVSWNEYCRRGNARWETRKDKVIVPTCPPHPIGAQGRGARKNDQDKNTWGEVIENWVAGVRRQIMDNDEDHRRKK